MSYSQMEELKQTYFKVKTETVTHIKDLIQEIKWLKSQELNEKIKELEQEIENLKNTKKYGLVWDSEKEPEQVVLDCQNKLPILKEKKDKKIINDDSWDSNILIQGDNYHSLQVLNYTHKEAIDVIYIDPPYNTGNKDFIYNDKYIDKEDSYKHSKWLNFMEKRLKLAQNLLKEDGVIFISIDDNEQAQLKLLCDEIFWEDNMISQIIWKKKRWKDNSAKFFSKTHEYLFCYAKNITVSKIYRVELDEQTKKAYKNKDNDPRWNYRVLWLWARWSQWWSKYDYKFKNWIEIKWLLWLVNKDSMKKLEDDNRLIFVWEKVYRKLFLSETNWSIPETLWVEHSNAANAADEIKSIFWYQNFETVKPLDYIKYIFKISSTKESLILDFTAWSWTTWHAVLDLNKEDSGNRKFILCTNNEVWEENEKKFKEKYWIDNETLKLYKKEQKKEWIDFCEENWICSTITYERIKRVSSGYTNSKWKDIEWLWGNLRYYETDFVEVESLKDITDKQKLELTYNAWELLAIKEWIYNELEKNKFWQIFENTTDVVAIYFAESTRKVQEMKERLQEIQAKKWWKVKWYIYNNPFDKTDFKDLKWLELKDIPDPILKVYREINRV